MRVITGSARGRRLKTLEGDEIVRPTTDRVKEALFSIVQFDLPGAKVLDLFAGSGQLGIEALSRGADNAVFVDKNTAAFETVKENLKATGLFQKSIVLNTDSVTYIKNSKLKFDLIIIDPPYNKGITQQVLPYAANCCNDGATIICETDFNEELPESVGSFVKFKEYKYSKTKLTTYRIK